jgi:DNA-binding response OmpR family regulator
VDVHVAKLRKKLGAHGVQIETVRGQGYRVSV